MTEDTSWWRRFRTTREDCGQQLRWKKFPHLQLVTSIDEGYAPTYEHSMELWIQYKNTAQIQGTPITNNMEQDDIDIMDDARNKLLEYTQTNAVDFIKGKKDINSDDDWGYLVQNSGEVQLPEGSGSCPALCGSV